MHFHNPTFNSMAYSQMLPHPKRHPKSKMLRILSALLLGSHTSFLPTITGPALTNPCREDFRIAGSWPPMTIHCSPKEAFRISERDIISVFHRSVIKFRGYRTPSMEMPKGDDHRWICKGDLQGSSAFFDLWLRQNSPHSFTYTTALRVLSMVFEYHRKNHYWGQSLCEIRVTPVGASSSNLMGLTGIREGNVRETCPGYSSLLSND